MNSVTTAIVNIGVNKLAKRFGKYSSAIVKWHQQGCLPQTELAGLTNYAPVIAELSQDTKTPVTVELLLADTREVWTRKAKPRGFPRSL